MMRSVNLSRATLAATLAADVWGTNWNVRTNRYKRGSYLKLE